MRANGTYADRPKKANAAELIVGRDRRGREVIANFQLPIADLIRAAASTPTLCRFITLW
jgi:hypothetical protein